MRHRISIALAILAVVLAGILFARVQFGQLSHPLLWHDEALTAIFAQRVLEYGYPKVHGPDGEIHYPMHHDLDVGTKDGSDAYIGSPWLQYYFAAAGAAWAEQTEDVHAKTFRLRLPFALAGGVGLAILIMLGVSSVRGSLERWIFTLLSLLAFAYSVLLVLHLREVRYYAITVLLVACGVAISAYRHVFQRLGFASHAVALAVVCVLLFNTFYLAFAGLAIGLGLNALFDSGLDKGAFGRRIAPLAIAALIIVPLLVFYETFDIASAFSDRYTSPKNAYTYKLFGLIKGWLRYEFLVPALAFHIATRLSIARASEESLEATEQRRSLSRLLLVVVGAYAAVVAMAPFYYERYSIAMSPLITLVMLLDGFTLWALWRGRSRSTAALAAAIACSLCLVTNLAVRAPDFAGRLAEISAPIEGPIDYAVRYIRTQYDEPEKLVIATNFEEPSLRFYLGSRVVLGWFNPDVAADLASDPDIIIPRLGNRHLDELKILASRGRFDRKPFPIRNVHANNVPSLAPWNHSRWVHRFETPAVDASSSDAFFLLERQAQPK